MKKKKKKSLYQDRLEYIAKFGFTKDELQSWSADINPRKCRICGKTEEQVSSQVGGFLWWAHFHEW